MPKITSNHLKINNFKENIEIKNDDNKNRSNNIINIVNNVNPNIDKNNIGLKVNINQYDIMYYIPKKKKDNKNELSENYESSKTSIDNITDRDMGIYGNSNKGEIRIDGKNGLNVDIINFKNNNKNKKKIKERSKEELQLEQKIKKSILKKIKSLNYLYKNGLNLNRPRLNKNDSSNNSTINEELKI